ncbi:MAG: O-methyltransferase [Flavobacteriaceae bacterium]|nr:O-methyltransferase [Flavobacteriaceae bacterium]
MDFLPKKIDQYVLEHSQSEPKLLQELNKETWQKALVPRMLSGHFQGRVLSILSKLIQPKSILEVGTYTGYSALCLAEGLKKNGALHTIDHNEELGDLQHKYINASKYKNQIKTYIGEALNIIPKINEKFDLVFIDADKENYINYFHAIIDKMNTGGVILSDNVLWSGKVTETPNPKDKDTIALIEYNKLLKNDPRIETVLLPIRDGLTISRVK